MSRQELVKMMTMYNVTVDPTASLSTVNWTDITPPDNPIPSWIGFVAAAVSVVLFGSNFLVVKKFETGDGMFFQWVLCCAVWLTGLCVHAVRGFPTFYPLAIVGGALWATGNLFVVPIVKTVGLSVGLCIWASVNMVSGWATSRFGWFGYRELPEDKILNSVGITLCFLSSFVFMMVKSDAGTMQLRGRESSSGAEPLPIHHAEEDYDSLLPQRYDEQNVNNPNNTVVSDPYVLETLSPPVKRVLGVIFAVTAGVLFGVNFVPVIYIYRSGKYPKASKDGLDYVFAHFCGIMVASSVYFFIYCMVRKNRPRVYPAAILPAMVSGVMWAVADSAWFVANSALTATVSFPIVTSLPGVVASLWGVFLLKEIKGVRNYLFLLLAIIMSVTGAALAGLSLE